MGQMEVLIRSNGAGTAGFVLSLCCLCLAPFTCGFSLFLAPVGLLISMIALLQPPRGMALSGMIVGGIGSLWLLIPFLGLAGLAAMPTPEPVATTSPGRGVPLAVPASSEAPITPDFTVTAEDSGEQPTNEVAPPASPSPAEAPSPSAPASSIPQLIGDVEVRITSIALEKVPLKSITGNTESKNPMLRIVVKLRNTSAAKRVDFTGWPRKHGFLSNLGARDEHGNLYKTVDFGFGTWPIGDDAGSTIDPGQEATAVLVLERPIDAATKLTLRLDGDALGNRDAEIKWLIDRKQWDRSDAIAKEADDARKREEQRAAQAAAALAAQEDDRRRQREQAEIRAKEEQSQKTRTWTAGAFSVEAEFLSRIGNQVKLRRLDNGKEVTVPIEKLSQADLDWLAEWAAKRAQ